MVARDSDPDKEDKHLNIMTVLEEELNKKGLAGKYSIIYRGSGQDKANRHLPRPARFTRSAASCAGWALARLPPLYDNPKLRLDA